MTVTELTDPRMMNFSVIGIRQIYGSQWIMPGHAILYSKHCRGSLRIFEEKRIMSYTKAHKNIEIGFFQI